MWELDHNEAEHQRIDAFKLWHLRRLLRILWTAKRSNQSILKEINPECSLEGLMLKHQYFSHLMRRADSLEKTLILGKIDGRRRSGRQRMRELDNSTNSKNMNFSKLGELVKNRGARHATVHGVSKSLTQLSDCKQSAHHLAQMTDPALSDRWTSIISSTRLSVKWAKLFAQDPRASRLQSWFVFKTNSWPLFSFYWTFGGTLLY